jgi:hypothetical protein
MPGVLSYRFRRYVVTHCPGGVAALRKLPPHSYRLTMRTLRRLAALRPLNIFATRDRGWRGDKEQKEWLRQT